MEHIFTVAYLHAYQYHICPVLVVIKNLFNILVIVEYGHAGQGINKFNEFFLNNLLITV